MKIKICGLTRIEDIKAVNAGMHERRQKYPRVFAAIPDFVGFVFAESPRRVTPGQAKELRAALHPKITPVGVFVNEPRENILALVRAKIIAAIQLHGAEDENFIATLKRFTEAPIIKAVSVKNAGDAQAWENSAADYLLLDNKTGGTGEAFDWNLIGELKKPFFLAGGLNPDNVAEAVQRVKPFAVDASSGVEISPGVKCEEKIRQFMKGAKI